MAAAKFDYLLVCQLLLERGADINIKNNVSTLITSRLITIDMAALRQCIQAVLYCAMIFLCNNIIKYKNDSMIDC